MDIAAMATRNSVNSLSTAVNMSLMNKTMDINEQMMDKMTEMMAETGEVGATLDVRG